MGKKDAQAMREMKAEFMSGALANGVAQVTAERVWELLLPFAGYAFNKAHAVCYAILAYQTAYLKANYPIEYMAGLLAVYRSREDRVTSFIEECRRQRIPILPPDVNRSVVDFTIEKPQHPNTVTPQHPESIRFGLAAIKGVGEGLVEGIIKERELNGPFKHLYEFAERMRPYGLTKLSLEALVRAGALDEIEPNRNRLLNVLEAALAYADSVGKDREAGQAGLFGGDEQNAAAVSYPILPDVAPPGRSETLAMEKDVMGIYVSDHPLRGYERLVTASASHSCAAALEQEDGSSVKLAGVIANMRQIVTKSRGERMATVVLEDLTGQIGVIVFPATFAKVRDLLIKDTVVQVSGVVMHRERNGERSIEVRLEEIKPLEAKLDLGPIDPFGGFVTIRLHKATESQLSKLRDVLAEHPGAYEVLVQVMPEEDHEAFLTSQRIDPKEEVVRLIKGCAPRTEVEIVHPKETGPTMAVVEMELAAVS
jgi:DNA polymerase-3 subunit alpha